MLFKYVGTNIRTYLSWNPFSANFLILEQIRKRFVVPFLFQTVERYAIRITKNGLMFRFNTMIYPQQQYTQSQPQNEACYVAEIWKWLEFRLENALACSNANRQTISEQFFSFGHRHFCGACYILCALLSGMRLCLMVKGAIWYYLIMQTLTFKSILALLTR